MSFIYKSFIKKQVHFGFIDNKSTLDSIFCFSLGLRKDVIFFDLDFSFLFFKKMFRLVNSLYYKNFRCMFTVVDENLLQITKRFCMFINQSFVFGHWPSGLLTNFKKINVHASFLQTTVKRFRDKLSLFSNTTGSLFFFIRTFLDGVDISKKRIFFDRFLDSKKVLNRFENSKFLITNDLLEKKRFFFDKPLDDKKRLIFFMSKFYKQHRKLNWFYIRLEKILPTFFPKLFFNLNYNSLDVYKPTDNFTLKLPSFSFLSSNVSLGGLPYPVPLAFKTIETIFFFFLFVTRIFFVRYFEIIFTIFVFI